jgi:hypothetical protein
MTKAPKPSLVPTMSGPAIGGYVSPMHELIKAGAATLSF